jgi:hypothetical protein
MDQVDRLILEEVGSAEVVRLTAALEAEERAFKAAVAAAQSHAAGTAQNDGAVRGAASNIPNLQNQLRAAESNLNKASAASGGLTHTISTLSFAVNDADQFTRLYWKQGFGGFHPCFHWVFEPESLFPIKSETVASFLVDFAVHQT